MYQYQTERGLRMSQLYDSEPHTLLAYNPEMHGIYSDMSDMSDDGEDEPAGTILIATPGVELSILQNYILVRPFLSKKCIHVIKDLIGICDELMAMLDGSFTMAELNHIYASASLAFLVHTSEENDNYARQKQKQLLVKAFRYSDTLYPMHLHLITDAILEALQTHKNIPNMKNAMRVAETIVSASLTGKMIANCLMWAILSEITGKVYYMNRLRKYDDWLDNLNMIHRAVIKKSDQAHTFYIILMVTTFIITAFVCTKNTELKRNGYGVYLALRRTHIMKFKLWSMCLLLKPHELEGILNTDLLAFAKRVVCLVLVPLLSAKQRQLDTAQEHS